MRWKVLLAVFMGLAVLMTAACGGSGKGISDSYPGEEKSEQASEESLSLFDEVSALQTQIFVLLGNRCAVPQGFNFPVSLEAFDVGYSTFQETGALDDLTDARNNLLHYAAALQSWDGQDASCSLEEATRFIEERVDQSRSLFDQVATLQTQIANLEGQWCFAPPTFRDGAIFEAFDVGYSTFQETGALDELTNARNLLLRYAAALETWDLPGDPDCRLPAISS